MALKKVSFALPANVKVEQGSLGGWWFSNSVCVVSEAEADKAARILERYYACTRHEGVYVRPEEVVEPVKEEPKPKKEEASKEEQPKAEEKKAEEPEKKSEPKVVKPRMRKVSGVKKVRPSGNLG